MKLQVLLAAGALTLLSAAPPQSGTSELDSVVGTDRPPVAKPALAKPAAPAAVKPERRAAPTAPSAYASKYYPPCTAQRTDRCRQGVRARVYRQDQREVRLAMRAGERG